MKINVAYSRTVNLGNFNSMRAEAGLEVEKLDLRGRMGVLLTMREEVRKEVRKMTSKFIECENCRGTGLVEEEYGAKCEECGGSGEVEVEEEEEAEENED